MRTLVLYTEDRAPRAAILEHDESFDVCTEEGINRIIDDILEADHLVTFFIELPDEYFRPTVTDVDGDEVMMRFVNIP